MIELIVFSSITILIKVIHYLIKLESDLNQLD